MMPMLVKELRGRMRGIGAPLLITIYVGLLAAILYGTFAISSRQVFFNGAQFALLGLQLFSMLNLFQLLLVVFIAPTLTAGAIAGEKERQTFDLLLSTRLSGFGILTGKLLAGISYAILLIAVSTPLFALTFIFGGVPLRLLFKALLVQGAWAVFLGACGLFFSTVSKRSQVATALAVVLALLLTFGSTMLSAFAPLYAKQTMMIVKGGVPYQVGQRIPLFYYANPMVGLTSATSMPNLPMSYPISIPFLTVYNLPNATTPLWKVQLLIVAGATVVLFLLSWAFLQRRPLGLRRASLPPAPVEETTAGA